MKRAVPFVLALLLALQWGTALAHCLRHAAPTHGTPAFSIEVCTSEGLVALPWPGGPWPGDPAPATQAAPMACPACAALAAIDPPAPPALAQPVVFTALVFAVVGPRAPPAPLADHPGRPRAPPAA
jgi:hypothetical protein